MPEEKAIRLYTDGACRGNPGNGGAGAVLFDEQGGVVATAKKFLGTCTNNEAEYAALILGLQEACSSGHKTIQVFLDSELLVRQINGVYRVKNTRLKELMKEVQRHLSMFDGYTVKHVPRSENAVADRLANEAIDDELDMG
ncbi:MAG: ribonuclease HI family protein [Deltaproteobacteria bacterium]|nr:ribonuclease HI family protein [Deltaproteobacteria bacterium]